MDLMTRGGFMMRMGICIIDGQKKILLSLQKEQQLLSSSSIILSPYQEHILMEGQLRERILLTWAGLKLV